MRSLDFARDDNFSMPGVFELLKRGWDLYTKNVRSYYIFILLFLAASLVMNFVSILYGPTLGTLLAKNWDQIMSFSLITFPLFVILFYTELTILYALALRLEARSVDTRDTFRTTGLRLLPALGAYLLSTLAVLVGAILVAVAFVNAGKDMLADGDISQLSIAATVSFLLGIILIVVGIILIFWFFFGHLEALLANKSPIAALRSSYRMVHGHWWAIFGRVLGTMIIISTVVYLINNILDWLTITTIMAKVFKAGAEAQNMGKLAISTILGVLVAPWGYGITILLYKAMKKDV